MTGRRTQAAAGLIRGEEMPPSPETDTAVTGS
jgi:hypothetical protein